MLAADGLLRRPANQKGRLTMTAQNQTPDIAENEDVEGHEHHYFATKGDDTEGHGHTWNRDSHSIKDDDTEGHQHGSI
jgi:hypothetical protein